MFRSTRLIPLLLLLFVACRAPDDTNDGGPDGDADVDPPRGVEAFFTNPPDDESAAERLVELIDGAETSIDLAAFVLDHDEFLDAVERAAERGVVIRVVGDTEVADDEYRAGFDQLRSAGAEITLQDNSRFNSHNKFVIVDGEQVWMGATNFTFNGFHRNNNASLLIHSSEVAADFGREFEQMFSGIFGTSKSRTDEETRFFVDDIDVETAFAPQEHPDELLIELAENAEENIFFMIYVFTLDELANALVRASVRGVTVSGIVDEGFAEGDGAAMMTILRNGGINLGIDVNPWAWHHKVMIVDPQGENPVVAVGSGNWTWSMGHGNDESYVIVRDREVVRDFLEEFQAWQN